ncbi:Codeine O-demethylase [Bienertia sinuspersici]
MSRKIHLKDVIIPAIDASFSLWEDTLLIDFLLLSEKSSSAQNQLSKLHSALNHWGCFQVINHGMTTSFLDELLDDSRQKKLKCSIAEDFFNGYGNGAAIAGANWNDRLFLTVYPEDQRKLQVWPQKPQNFRQTLHEFCLSLRIMVEVILKAMARSLELTEDSFLNEHGEQGTIDTRFGIYPPCSRPDEVYGVHPHSDRSSITILLQDNDVSEGLHIQKKMINGSRFQSSLEHYLLILETLRKFSVAAFCTPEPENDVGPINKLVSPKQPQLFKKVNMKTYKQLFFETYPWERGCLML